MLRRKSQPRSGPARAASPAGRPTAPRTGGRRRRGSVSAQPVILVAPSTEAHGVELADVALSLAECYPRAILAAGGLPVVLSCTPAVEYIAASVRRCAGVMLTGGEDVQPRLYAPALGPAVPRGGRRHEPERDLFELMLLAEVFRQHKPLLAICRGHQLTNVAFGGTLWPELPHPRPGGVRHLRLDRKSDPVHPIQLAPDSLIAGLLGGAEVRVNSTHHQAIDRLAQPFRATATSADGIIEAIELRPAARPWLPWFLGVQFHPERLVAQHPVFAGLFAGFVRACAQFGSSATAHRGRRSA